MSIYTCNFIQFIKLKIYRGVTKILKLIDIKIIFHLIIFNIDIL